MGSSDFRREDNYRDYLRLSQSIDYVDVMFDEESGGMSAVHKDHRLDKQRGPAGEPRGSYELKTIDTLRKNGHGIVLLKESGKVGVKQYDGLLDGIPCEIKAVEKLGRWTVRTKVANAIRQGAVNVVLYFPDSSIFSEQRVQDGWKDCLSYATPNQPVPEIQLYCIVNGAIRRIEKPSW